MKGKSVLDAVNSTLSDGFEETRTENYEDGELVSVKVVRKSLTPRRRRILERLKTTLEKAKLRKTS